MIFASGAGAKAGFDDESYAAAGAVMRKTNEEIWSSCGMIVKVKEIEPSEYDLIREGQIIFTCIHPAAHREEVDVLLDELSHLRILLIVQPIMEICFVVIEALGRVCTGDLNIGN